MNSEENKALLRQFIEEFDRNWGSVDYLDKWFTDDVKLHFNGVTMDLADFKEMLPAFYNAFTDLRHEVHFMVAEDDLVTWRYENYNAMMSMPGLDCAVLSGPMYSQTCSLPMRTGSSRHQMRFASCSSIRH